MKNSASNFIKPLILILAFILLSCGKDDTGTNPTGPPETVDTSSFQYPFTIGSKWNYSITKNAENIRPDSIQYRFSNYPVTGAGYSEILYDTVIPFGGPVRVIYDRQIIGNDTIASRYYYTNSEYSMVCYGYRGPSTPAFPFRKSYENNNVPGLFSLGQQYSSAPDSFIVLSPVVIVIKYPVIRNTQWQLFNFGSYTISKKYLSWENYHLDTAVIPCIKTQRINTYDNDWYLYNYYSAYGQMKRDYLFKNKAVPNEFGLTIGYYDEHNLYTITSFSIAE